MQQSKYHLKVVCGFRKEQEFTINANEAHKAYYLFNNPDKRGTFDNGLAIKGSDISRIIPDYCTTMGWNPTHVLTDDDYNELRENGVMKKLQGIMSSAKEIARIGDPDDLAKPLIELKDKMEYLEQGGSIYAKQLLGR